VLLIGAGLLIHSFERLTRVGPGFRPNHFVVFDVGLPGEKYRYDPPQNAFANNVMARLASLPGTQAVAAMATRPLDPNPGFVATPTFTVDRAWRNQALASTERTSAA
jgi:hypothetical protein